jgi:hypothetical protein
MIFLVFARLQFTVSRAMKAAPGILFSISRDVISGFTSRVR